VRAVVLRVDGLDPAPEGQYYEMWFAYNGESMPLVAFNTSDDGSVEVRGAMPAGMGWESCWITLEGDGSRPPATVLKAS
jgi:anti-sigma-K factor RskA